MKHPLFLAAMDLAPNLLLTAPQYCTGKFSTCHRERRKTNIESRAVARPIIAMRSEGRANSDENNRKMLSFQHSFSMLRTAISFHISGVFLVRPAPTVTTHMHKHRHQNKQRTIQSKYNSSKEVYNWAWNRP
jgi:hypothetical protein